MYVVAFFVCLVHHGNHRSSQVRPVERRWTCSVSSQQSAVTHSKSCIEILHHVRVLKNHVFFRRHRNFFKGKPDLSSLFQAVRREFWNSRKRFDAELGRIAEKVEQAHRSPSEPPTLHPEIPQPQTLNLLCEHVGCCQT